MEKINPKDIYQSLWRCRDFELSHLWQRSIFLTAFLVMCFTGYTALAVKASELAQAADGTCSFAVLCGATLLVSLLGYVFSVLWVKMAKGSKAWYERYENSLTYIERCTKYSQAIVAKDMDRDKVMHGSLWDPNKPNDALWSTQAGYYSVSRINIIIGQVFMVVWFILYLASVGMLIFSEQFHACKGWFVVGALGIFSLIHFLVARPSSAHSNL